METVCDNRQGDVGWRLDLLQRRRFGMKPGLDAIRAVCAELGDPQKRFRSIHVAGTNGKGAVTAILDSCLRAAGLQTGRFTSPHLVRLNERFFLDGRPLGDEVIDAEAARVEAALSRLGDAVPEFTFFEALTAVAFLLYARFRPDFAILETGLGGRLDATNVCVPALCVVTRIGLDHCDWLGDTVEKIAAEKAGIVKAGTPVVLGRNAPEVRAVVKARADELGAPFVYAPDVADESEIPVGFSLAGAFNRENAVTAIAALKTLGRWNDAVRGGFAAVTWPGRFQRVGDFIVDGAHNPPAAAALAEALGAAGFAPRSLSMVAGFCSDKDVAAVLGALAPFVGRGFAVKTVNPRSLSAEDAAAAMSAAGIESVPCESLRDALSRARGLGGKTLVCGSLFLAGEALVELGAYPWGGEARFDPSEKLR